MKSIYTAASTSSSTTYGNVMSFIKEKLVQSFPMGIFKDVNMNSELAFVNVRRRLGMNSLTEMKKLERPYMTLSPQFEVPSGDQYLYDIPLTKNFDNVEYGVSMNTLFPAIVNKRDNWDFVFKLNRDQIKFDVTIAMNTKIQQLDMYKFLVNHFTWERPFTVDASLESMIPREIVKQIGLLNAINIDDSDKNNIPTILQTMNRWSTYPITYKIRNGTATDEFFMYYNAHILCTYDNLTIDEGQKKNMADDLFQMRFSITAEFNLPGMYLLIGKDPKPRELDIDLGVISSNGYHDLIPLYTVTNFFQRYPEELNGFIYYINSRFTTDAKPGAVVDHLDITVLFDEDRKRTISRYVVNNIPITTLVKIILIKDDNELSNGNDYVVDWSKFSIDIMNPDNDATYRIVIYINNLLFEEEKTALVENQTKDKPGLDREFLLGAKGAPNKPCKPVKY